MAFQVSDPRAGYILNKSENATPELFAIFMQKKKCNPVKQMKVYLTVQMLGYAQRKRFTDDVPRKHMKVRKRAKIRNRYNQANT